MMTIKRSPHRDKLSQSTLDAARRICPGILPGSVKAIFKVGHEVRRIMTEHSYSDEFSALILLAEAHPAAYDSFARAAQSDPAFAAMTTPLLDFIARVDSLTSMNSARRLAA